MEHLSEAQVEHFLRCGFGTVEGRFTREAARDWLDTAWVRLGYHRDDPAGWTEKRIQLAARAESERRAAAGRS